MIEFLLLDLDDTILDFHKAERIALSKTLLGLGVDPSPEALERYHQINRWHWEQLEKGLYTRDQVLVGRFGQFFRELGVDVAPELAAKTYEQNLSQGHYFLPGAEEALEELYGRYRMFLLSNGTASVQKGRLTSANLYRFFERVFVSQEIGANKPDRAFFDACFSRIPGFAPERALMVGDSLSSDIRGGVNAGVATVWIHPDRNAPADPVPTYRLGALRELPELLEELAGGERENSTAGVSNLSEIF